MQKMTKSININGFRFGLLIAIAEEGRKYNKILVKCKCDCGNYVHVAKISLTRGITKSCGCLRRATTSATKTIHGMSRTRTHQTWMNMIRRCTDERATHYKEYGGRGIGVCDRWRVFENFIFDMGIQPDFMTIERIDNNGNYTPENCIWKTKKEQANNRRSNRNITFNCVTKTLSEWAETTGIKRETISYRLKKGWPIERALNPDLAAIAAKVQSTPTQQEHAK